MKVQVGPVVVAVPSLTVTYHSNFWPAPRLAHEVVVLVPEATPVFWPIWVKLPLANGRPKKVTVIGLESGSDTPTLSVGEVLTPVAPSAGLLRVGALGAALAARAAICDADSAVAVDAGVVEQARVEPRVLSLCAPRPTGRCWSRSRPGRRGCRPPGRR